MKDSSHRAMMYMSLKRGYRSRVISKERREEINKIIKENGSRH